MTIKTTNSDEADFDATAEASHELFSKDHIDLGENQEDKVQNAQNQKSIIEEQRRKNYIQMIQSQKGFFFAIFASSFVISTLLIISFTVFVFNFGFTQPNPFNQTLNYNVLQSSDFDNFQAYKNTSNLSGVQPSWSGTFTMGAIQRYLKPDTKYFMDLKHYFYEAVVGNIQPRLGSSNFSRAAYEIRNAKKFGYQALQMPQEDIFEVDLDVDLHDVKMFTNTIPKSGATQIGKNIIMNKSAGRNEEMHQLYQIIVQIVLYLVVPHYLLVSLVNFLYKPRLAQMIYRFKEEMMERNKIITYFDLRRIFGQSFNSGSNDHGIDEIFRHTIENSQRGFIDIR